MGGVSGKLEDWGGNHKKDTQGRDKISEKSVV